jgi:hypothetical protein
VQGTASASTGTTYGVHGSSSSSSASSAGVYAESGRNGGTALRATLNSTGSSGSIALFYDRTTQRVRISRSGTIYANGVAVTSDARLKRDVAKLGSVLPKLASVDAYRYRMKDPGVTGTQIGMLAQEVREQFPELVQEQEDGKLSLNYTQFSAVLLKGMKEQQAEIESQRQEIDQRDRRIEELEERMARIEKLLTEPAAAGAK